jgi:3D (Asp-Asp-Asp) domain-containing protein
MTFEDIFRCVLLCIAFILLCITWYLYGKLVINNNTLKVETPIQEKVIIKYHTPDFVLPFTEYDLQLIEDNSDVIELKGITITSYNNEERQTDSTPHIMASNRMVYEGAVAISRDLKEKHKLKWGDFVLLDSDRLYVIEDLMNERYKNQVDIFSFDKKLSKKINFKNQEIKIYKLKR